MRSNAIVLVKGTESSMRCFFLSHAPDTSVGENHRSHLNVGYSANIPCFLVARLLTTNKFPVCSTQSQQPLSYSSKRFANAQWCRVGLNSVPLAIIDLHFREELRPISSRQMAKWTSTA